MEDEALSKEQQRALGILNKSKFALVLPTLEPGSVLLVIIVFDPNVKMAGKNIALGAGKKLAGVFTADHLVVFQNIQHLYLPKKLCTP